MTRFFLSIVISLSFCSLHAQTWVDSLTSFAHEKYLPAKKFKWTWVNAPLLRSMIVQYETGDENSRDFYLDYIQTAMNSKAKRASAKRPNTVAPANGFAFLAKVLMSEKYAKLADKIYADYLKIPRTSNGGVTHLARTPELWDDTMYMIGVFLLEMYRYTEDEKYIHELMEQLNIHRDKLLDKEVGLWVHGWDDNDSYRCTICGQRDWPNADTRRSEEFWGRGNGWIVVLLSDILKTIPQDSPYWFEASSYLKEMLEPLVSLQDSTTGHWYQLPLKPKVEGNYIESSSTAMFAYGMLTALQYKLVEDRQSYQTCIDKAYVGLREHSIVQVDEKYLNTQNVCVGTCIGNENYYINRKTTTGKAYAIGMFIIFGLNYEVEMGMRSN